MKDRTLTPQDLCTPEFLNIKLATLYSHISRKTDLPPSFKVGSQTRWRESEVLKWIEARENKKRRKDFED
jgi:predicted DNA-binding transcriptional regulator AlpA